MQLTRSRHRHVGSSVRVHRSGSVARRFRRPHCRCPRSPGRPGRVRSCRRHHCAAYWPGPTTTRRPISPTSSREHGTPSFGLNHGCARRSAAPCASARICRSDVADSRDSSRSARTCIIKEAVSVCRRLHSSASCRTRQPGGHTAVRRGPDRRTCREPIRPRKANFRTPSRCLRLAEAARPQQRNAFTCDVSRCTTGSIRYRSCSTSTSTIRNN